MSKREKQKKKEVLRFVTTELSLRVGFKPEKSAVYIQLKGNWFLLSFKHLYSHDHCAEVVKKKGSA